MIFTTNSPMETERIGEALGKILPAGTILAYEGDLGAGKTAVLTAALEVIYTVAVLTHVGLVGMSLEYKVDVAIRERFIVISRKAGR